MTTRQLKRLNHYPEFRTVNGIDQIKNYINTLNFPNGLNGRQQARYTEKFGVGSGFVVRNNLLFYNPNANIDVEVVTPIQDVRENRIRGIYNNIARGLGVGLNAFYHQIAMSYLNIPKKITDDFLRKQGDYKVGIVPTKIINKPIIARVPNERWGVDLIDMTNYVSVRNPRQLERYIFTAVDYFSGRVFARAILNRNNNDAQPTLSNALSEICRLDAQNTYPHLIQADGEFATGNFRNWCVQNNINLIKTTSYTPTSCSGMGDYK